VACGGAGGAVFFDEAASAKLFDALSLVAVLVAGVVFGAEGLTGAAGVADCFAEAVWRIGGFLLRFGCR
jgi:hypothetical protein